MFRGLLLIVFFLGPGVAWANFLAQIDLKAFGEHLAKKGACSTVASAQLCRHFPWTPRLSEGVVEWKGMAFLFIKSMPPADEPSRLARWSEKFSEENARKYYSLFAVLNTNFANALNASPFVSIYVMVLNPDNTLLDALIIGRQALLTTISQNGELEKELDSAVGEWVPPESFNPTFEFYSNTP